MVHRELSASHVSDAILLDLIDYEDPRGVLSVYVEMPADGADRRAEIEVNTALTASYLYGARFERVAGEDDR